MRVLEMIGEDEMIAVFLKGEIASSRFGSAILDYLSRNNLDRRVIDQPDLASAEENERRRELLDAVRGYTRRVELFEGFPHDVTWMRAMLDRDDRERVRYINYDYWVELSGGTRCAQDAARNIQNGMNVFEVSSQPFLDAAAVFQPRPDLSEMILVGRSLDEDLVVLEGHFRLTIYALASKHVSDEIEAVVGISPRMAEWDLF